MSSGDVLNKIKDSINSYVGEEVRIKANRGRRKAIEKEGILEKTHSNVFVVNVDDDENRKMSYSYADLLTDNVELKVKSDEKRIGNI